MTGLKIETLHVDDEVPQHLRDIIEASATTGRNEYPLGGIVVALVADTPVVSLTVGPSDVNSRILEVRRVRTWSEDEVIAAEALKKAWRSVQGHAMLLYDGAHVDDAIAATIPGAGLDTTGFSDVSRRDVLRLVGAE